MGYLRTALRATTHVLNEDTPDCDSGLRWLIADVFSQQPPLLLEYAKTFLPVKQYLQNQSEIISQAFQLTELGGDEIFDNYPLEQREIRTSQFKQSYSAWQNWLDINAHEVSRG